MPDCAQTETYSGPLIAQAIDILLSRLQSTTVSKVQISFRESATKSSGQKDCVPGFTCSIVDLLSSVSVHHRVKTNSLLEDDQDDDVYRLLLAKDRPDLAKKEQPKINEIMLNQS